MKKIVSQDKMSKKAQREMNKARREFWHIKPVTRVKDTGKAYNRQKEKLACKYAF